MDRRRTQPPAQPRAKRPPANHRRERLSFGEVLARSAARATAEENRRTHRRKTRTMEAVIAGAITEPEEDRISPLLRLKRWIIGGILLPLGWVTVWTFLSQFSHATVHQGFWQTEEFWYFATGCLLMGGWFACGLLRDCFLYLYVLGHEFTHALFVILHFGWVSKIHVKADGGHILTNKTNWLISLSPYFVPFWALVLVSLHLLIRHFFGWQQEWDRPLYALIGASCTFHFVWTLRVLPLDQPDLRENGTFLSLVVILLGNLLVVSGLFCIAADDPLDSAKSFGREWIRYAATGGDTAFRWLRDAITTVRTVGRF